MRECIIGLINAVIVGCEVCKLGKKAIAFLVIFNLQYFHFIRAAVIAGFTILFHTAFTTGFQFFLVKYRPVRKLSHTVVQMKICTRCSEQIQSR